MKFRKQAAALQYDPASDQAPRLLVKGSGKNAEAIIKKAEESGVPVKENEGLLEGLMLLPEKSEIPENLYRLTAAVFALLQEADARYVSRKQSLK